MSEIIENWHVCLAKIGDWLRVISLGRAAFLAIVICGKLLGA